MVQGSLSKKRNYIRVYGIRYVYLLYFYAVRKVTIQLPGIMGEALFRVDSTKLFLKKKFFLSINWTISQHQKKEKSFLTVVHQKYITDTYDDTLVLFYRVPQYFCIDYFSPPPYISLTVVYCSSDLRPSRFSSSAQQAQTRLFECGCRPKLPFENCQLCKYIKEEALQN